MLIMSIMETFEFCELSTVLSIFLFVKTVINIIQIIVPVILIVTSLITIGKAVASSADEIMKVVGTCRNKFIGAVVVFMVPVLVNLILNLTAFDQTTIVSCMENSTPEYIEIAREREAAYKEANKQKPFPNGPVQVTPEDDDEEENTSWEEEQAGPGIQGPVRPDDGTTGLSGQTNTEIFDPSDVTKPTPASVADLKRGLQSITSVRNLSKGGIMTPHKLDELAHAYKEAEFRYGINAVFLVSISAWESGWGTSELAEQCNNLGGVKYTAGTTRCGTGLFRKYKSKEEFITKHAALLKGYGYKDIESINRKYCPEAGCSSWAREITAISNKIIKGM